MWKEKSLSTNAVAGRRFSTAALVLVAAIMTGPGAGAAEPTPARTDAERGTVISEKQFCEQRLAGDFWMKTELYFGLSKPNGQVSEEEFNNFVDSAVTPRFPDGLTLLRARGQFRDASGDVVEEGSRLLILLYPFSGTSSRAVDAIREDYKLAFQQQSVLRVDEKSCISF
jgi:Protein of unknown function (DUF3574)